MFREDYIVRMIAQATTAINHILGLSQRERYPEALAEVEQALQYHLGLNLGLVTALPAAELVEMARQGEMLDIGKVVVLADLLQAEGDVYQAQGQPGEAADRHAKALELYLEVAASGAQNRLAVAERLDALAAKLPPEAIHPDVQAWWDHLAAGAPDPQADDGADPAG